MQQGLDDMFAAGGEAARRVARLTRDPAGRLLVHFDGVDEPAADLRLVRYFPWSMPGAYVSVRDERGRELAVIVDLDELDPDSRGVLDAELRNKVFNPRILRVVEYSHEFGISSVRAETDRGPVNFQFRGRSAFRLLSPTRALIRDVDNNTYELPDFSALDAASRKHLRRFF